MPANGRRTVRVVVNHPVIEDNDRLLIHIGISSSTNEYLKSLKFSLDSPIEEGLYTCVKRTSGEIEKIDPSDINKETNLEGIVIVIPIIPKEKEVFIEKDPNDPYHYFSATFSNIKHLIKGKEISKKMKKISIFYDVSNSRKRSERRRDEIRFLREFLKIYKVESFNINTFSYKIHETRTFENVHYLLEFMNSQRFDGGTNLPLKEIYQLNNSDSDLVFLLTDGISNFGRIRKDDIKNNFKVPIFCICSSYISNYSLLRYIGEESGGGYFDLSQDDSIESSLLMISHERIPLKNIICDPEDAVDKIISSRISNNDDKITIFGRILKPEKKPLIRLQFGSSSFSSDIQLLITIQQQQQNQSSTTTLIRSLWAQKRIEELSLFQTDLEKEKKIKKIGLKYGIVTPKTSLMVLSTYSQYLKHNIIPPKSLKEMRKKYLHHIEEEKKTELERRSIKLEKVVKKWEDRISWHQRDFLKEYIENKNKEDLRRKERKKREEKEARERKQKKIEREKRRKMEKSERLKKDLEFLRNEEFEEMEDFHLILGVSEESSSDEIRKAYKRRILKYHPDLNPDDPKAEEKMKAINQAYEILKDPNKRKIYETQGEICDDEKNYPFDSFFSFSGGGGGRGLQTEGQGRHHHYQRRDAYDDDDDDDDPPPKKKESIKINNNKEEKKKKKKSEFVIKVKSYQPNADYMKKIRASETPYLEYLNQREIGDFNNSPSFYLDCCDYFLSSYIFKKKKNEKEEEEEEEGEEKKDSSFMMMMDNGIRILSNLTELELENPQLLRIVGYRLDQAGLYEDAISIFEKVLESRPQDPQSYRDLALVLEKHGDFEKPIKLLLEVVLGNWDERFSEIEMTAVAELNHIIFYNNSSSSSSSNHFNKEENLKKYPIDERLIYHMGCQIRISMAWDTDNTDIDLHVRDPNFEHVYYGHRSSVCGGFISRDFTRGYGPEEFMQKKVNKTGKFKISAKYFANHQQSMIGGTTILCTFFTNYMLENEKQEMVTLRLNKSKEEIQVCEIEVICNDDENTTIENMEIHSSWARPRRLKMLESGNVGGDYRRGTGIECSVM